MKIEQKQWTEHTKWSRLESSDTVEAPQLVLGFGTKELIRDEAVLSGIREWYPDAHILLGSTAGEIIDTQVRDNTISLTAIEFEKATLAFGQVAIENADESEAKGKEAAAQLPKDGLVHVMIFSDGMRVNGTALVSGVMSELPAGTVVTGGLVGDGANFKETALGLDEVPGPGKIIVVGFYGDSLKVGHGSLGGWDPFGPERLITKSKGNVLYELDGKPALELYKEYLGDEAKDLPGSGLLFPLQLKATVNGLETEVVRTLLAVNEEDNSMTFAGDMPEGSFVTLMKANFDRLVDGAKGAAQMTAVGSGEGAKLAVLISCIGRKLVLKERIEDETEAVREVLGTNVAMAGFYSYGEISPVAATEQQCRLHNQTMTITTFAEI